MRREDIPVCLFAKGTLITSHGYPFQKSYHQSIYSKTIGPAIHFTLIVCLCAYRAGRSGLAIVQRHVHLPRKQMGTRLSGTAFCLFHRAFDYYVEA